MKALSSELENLAYMTKRKKVASILWERLNADGSDACHLFQQIDGWSISGTAVFMGDKDIAHLDYEVKCDTQWVTQSGSVRGSIGAREIDLTVIVDRERWYVNQQAVGNLQGCVDLDLNFSPSTNLIQFRRLELAVGVSVAVPVAWLALPEFQLKVLPQNIRRIDSQNYDYAAPTVSYRGVIKVTELGFVLEYPELWKARSVQIY